MLESDRRLAVPKDEDDRDLFWLLFALVIFIKIWCYWSWYKSRRAREQEESNAAGAGAETSQIAGQLVMPAARDVQTLPPGAPHPGMYGPPGAIQSQGGPPPMTGPAGYGAPPGGSMPASLTDPSGCGVWEPQKDLQTGKIYWTNHTLQKTTWDPPTGGTAGENG